MKRRATTEQVEICLSNDAGRLTALTPLAWVHPGAAMSLVMVFVLTALFGELALGNWYVTNEQGGVLKVHVLALLGPQILLCAYAIRKETALRRQFMALKNDSEKVTAAVWQTRLSEQQGVITLLLALAVALLSTQNVLTVFEFTQVGDLSLMHVLWRLFIDMILVWVMLRWFKQHQQLRRLSNAASEHVVLRYVRGR